MPNEITMSIYKDTLMHYGILGMHWGVRRYQPYGEGGYDPDHKGRNVGLAARLAGGGSSYSSIYGRGASRGSSPLSRNGGINVGPSNAMKRLSRGVSEGLERLNYANDRLGQGIKNAGKKARGALNEYAGTMKTTAGKVRIQEDVDRAASYDTKTAMKMAAFTLKSNARMSVHNVRNASRDDVMKALGTGADRFKSAMSKTAVKSKEFGRSAAMTAALLGGALDPTSSASQIMGQRSKRGVQPRSAGAHIGKNYSNTLAPINQMTKAQKARSGMKTLGGIVDSGTYGSYHLGKLKVPQKAIDRSKRNAALNYKHPEKTAREFASQGKEYYEYNKAMSGALLTHPSVKSIPTWEYRWLVDDFKTAPINQVSSSTSADLGRKLLGL